MADQAALIARKTEVQRQIEQHRRQLEHARQQNDSRQNRTIRKLEDQLDRLMAEETRLRLAIDRSR